MITVDVVTLGKFKNENVEEGDGIRANLVFSRLILARTRDAILTNDVRLSRVDWKPRRSDDDPVAESNVVKL